jgi:nucleoside-diphosphate-sugar epimerase
MIGGTGFLGSFVAARLADRTLAVLARSSSDISVLPRHVQVVRGELGDPLPLEGVNALVYCASMGFGHVPPLINQLESARIERVLFVSTTAIFTTLPSTSLDVRLAAEAAVSQSALDWTILRPTMIYGTARDRNISRLLRILKRSPVFPVCGNGLWQPIYVHDLADAVVNALDNSRTSRKTYNVAGAVPLRFADLVRVAAAALSKRVRLLSVPLSAAVIAARLTHAVTPEQIRRLAEDKAFDYTPAARDFGFAPRSFEDGVRREVHSLGLS